MMTKVIVDAATQTRLNNLAGLLEVCDESGKTLGYFHPAGASVDSGAARSPFSQEELERRRRQRTGRPLPEILEGLKQS